MVRRIALVFLSLSPMFFASYAAAANLEIKNGEVLLSRGNGYRAIHASTEIGIGDVVVGRPDSMAQITFADGCVVRLRVGIVFAVEPQSPCQSGRSSATDSAVAASTGSSGMTIADDAGWGAATETLPVAETQADLMPYLLGAAAIGGIAVAASALGGGGDNEPPVSP
jgi:hypothetical protein